MGSVELLFRTCMLDAVRNRSACLVKKELDFAALHMAKQGFDGLIRHKSVSYAGFQACNVKVNVLLDGFALGGFALPGRDDAW